MTSIGVEHPEWLWLLLALIPVAWFGWRQLNAAERVRRSTIVFLRVTLFAILIVALAGPTNLAREHRLTVIGIVDVSGSVREFADLAHLDESADTIDNIEVIRQWFRDAVRERQPDDRFGLVAFDGRTIAVTVPTTADDYADDQIQRLRGEGTNLADALRYASAMFAPGSARRLVLVSDGNATAGDTLAAAEEAAASIGGSIRESGLGIPIDVLPITYHVGGEVILDRIETPTWGRPGQWITLRIVLESTGVATGRLHLTLENIPVDMSERDDQTARRITLQPGLNVEMVQVQLGDQPVSRFEATFVPDDPDVDALRQNNRAEAFTMSPQEGSVLIVSGEENEAGRLLAEVLTDAGLAVRRVGGTGLPRSPIELNAYDLIILQNVAAEDILPAQQEQLARYVENLGGGLIMIGGYDSFGAGGWEDTPVEAILPVSLKVPEEVRIPTAAIAIVLDRSGSMAEQVFGSRLSKQEIANEGAAIGVESLDKNDWVTVIAFDAVHDTVVPMQRVGEASEISAKIRAIFPAGGTNLGPAMEVAFTSLTKVEADVKHVICLSDGHSQGGDFDEIARRMKAQNITVSTIAVGDDADRETLEEIAEVGGGAFYVVRNPRILPRIFLKDIRVIRRPLIREISFIPTMDPTTSPIAGTLKGAIPLLHGLVLTERRDEPNVNTILSAPGSEPILAHWQYGLGQVGAFTSDAHDRWATDWLGWPGYRQMWTHLARLIARPAGTQNFELKTRFENDRLIITLSDEHDYANETDDENTAQSQTETLLAVTGMVYSPDGSEQSVRLRLTGPGTYSASIEAEDSGTYVVALTPRRRTGGLDLVLGGTTRQAGLEYRRLTSDIATLHEISRITGGRLLDWNDPPAANLFDRSSVPETVTATALWATLLWWAIGLFLVDAAARRLAWDWPTLKAYLAGSRAALLKDAETKGHEAAATLSDLRRASAASSLPRADYDVSSVDEEGKSGRAPIRFIEPEITSATTTPPPKETPEEAEAKRRRALDALKGRRSSGEPSSSDDANEADDESSTTSNLFAARRRARQRFRNDGDDHNPV